MIALLFITDLDNPIPVPGAASLQNTSMPGPNTLIELSASVKPTARDIMKFILIMNEEEGNEWGGK